MNFNQGKLCRECLSLMPPHSQALSVDEDFEESMTEEEKDRISEEKDAEYMELLGELSTESSELIYALD